MEIVLLGLMLVLGLLAWVFVQKSRGLSGESSTAKVRVAYKKQTLLSPAERSFYGVLRQAVGETYQVQVKVRLADLVQPASGLSRSDWQAAFNRISSKHVDFVLVNPATFEVACALELDDSSHATDKRFERDAFLDAAFQSAGLRLLHVPAKNAYAVQEIRAMLGLETTSPSSPRTVQAYSQPVQAAPACPKCAAPMVKRQASRGEHMGKLFWACSRYPECRSVVPIGEVVAE